MSEIFISYARSTESQALRVEAALCALGYSVWRDNQLLPHRAYSRVLAERLNEAKAVLVLWSHDAIDSDWVRSEANQGRAGNKLVQASVDGVRPPMPFDQIQCAQLRDWSGDLSGPDWERVAKSISDLVGRPAAEDVERPPAAPPVAPAAPARKPRRRMWIAAGIAGVVILAAGGAGVWAWRHSHAVETVEEPRVALTAFKTIGDDPAARAFASRLAEDISAVMGENAAGLEQAGPGDGRQASTADLVLGGTVSREGEALRVRVYLEDPRADAVVWSAQFERPLVDERPLRDQVAVAVTNTLYTAMEPLRQKGLHLDARTLAIYIKASESIQTQRLTAMDEPLRGYEEVVARAPDFVNGRATLAGALAGASARAPEGQKAALARRARAEAEHAIRLDPHQASGAYDALYFLARREAPSDLVGAEDNILKGIAAAPDNPWLRMRECRFLLEVGRAGDARSYCERAIALRPLASPIGHPFASALNATGERELAQQAIERFARYYPDSVPTRRVRFELALFRGSPDLALSILRDPARRPQYISAEALLPFELLIKARKTGSEADARAALDALRAAVRPGPLGGGRYMILGAVTLGRLDEAFAILNNPALTLSQDPADLLDPAAAPLWRDRRFWPVAARAGYVRYWRSRDRWPDFCKAPDYPLDCRAEASRAAAL